MPIKLEVTGENPQEFTTNLGGVLALSFPRVAAAAGAAVGLTTGEAVSPANVKSRKSRSEKPTPEPEPETASQADVKGKLLSQADVKAKLLALLDAKGEDVPVALLTEFGVAKLSELPPDKYVEIVAKIEAALKG